MLPIHKIDLVIIAAAVQPSRLRRPGRAHFHKDLEAVIGKRLTKRAVADPVNIAQEYAAHAQRLARADNDLTALGVEPHHVKRRAGGNAQAAALADGEMNDAGMRAQHAAVEIDDRARFRRARLQPLDHLGVMTRRHEADVLAVMLLGDCQAEFAGKLTRLRLGAITERKAQQLELLTRGGEQEVALVALGLARAIEPAPAGRQPARGDVMAGGERLRAEFARGVEQIVKLDRHVAVDARHRRLAVDVALGEAVDHRFLEAALVVEHVVRNAEALGDAPGVVDVLTSATGALAVGGGTVVVELQGHADHVIAFGLEQRRGHRRIDAAGHGDDDTRGFRTAGKVEAVEHNTYYYRCRAKWRNEATSGTHLGSKAGTRRRQILPGLACRQCRVGDHTGPVYLHNLLIINKIKTDEGLARRLQKGPWISGGPRSVASCVRNASRPLPPTRANTPRPSQADSGGSSFDSLIDDSLPPSPDHGSKPQAASQEAAAAQPPAQTQTQTDSKPAKPPHEGGTGKRAGSSATDKSKKAATDPQAATKSDTKSGTETSAKGSDGSKAANAGKTDGTVKPDPLPPGDGKKKSEKSEKGDKDKTAKTDTASKPSDAAASGGTPAAPDPTAAQTPPQQGHANAQGQTQANVTAAATVIAPVQGATQPDHTAVDSDKTSPKAKTPAVTAAVSVGDIGGPTAKQSVQSGAAGQATPQAQTPAPQDPTAQMANANPASAPDGTQKAVDQKSAADARGETPAKIHRFTLPDASSSATANTHNTPAPSATDVAQALNVPTSANQAASQTTTAAAATATPPQAPPAAPVPLAGVAVAIAARASTGKNSFSIRLDPPELGRVDVRLSVDKDGHITSHLIADRKDTLSLLQRDASGLQRALQDAGFKTADNGLQFSLRDSFAGQQQQQQQQQQSSGNAAGHIVLNDETSTTDAIPSGYGRYLGRAGGVDIRV
jgi:flagellar hook-length control protein FliK